MQAWKREFDQLFRDRLLRELWGKWRLQLQFCDHFDFLAITASCTGCCKPARAYPSLWLPLCTITMETFALLEGSDKDGFLKFPFLSENERKMLFWMCCAFELHLKKGGKKAEKAAVKVTEWKNFLRARNKLNPKEKIKCDFQSVRHKLQMTMIDSQTISVQYPRLHVLIYLSVASKRPLNIRLMPKLTFLANWKRHKLS